MEQKNPTYLAPKRRGVINISFGGMCFVVLCIYLVLIFVCYIDERLLSLVSLTLYGFVILGFLAVVSAGRIAYDTHMVWYGIFVLMCAFSCTYAYNVNTASDKTFEVVKLLVFMVMFINSVNSKQRLKTTLFVMMISSLVLFINLASTNQLTADDRLGTDLTGNANIFAAMFMVGAISSVYFVFFSEKRIMKIAALVIFVLQLYALALSGSRKNFLLPVLLLGTLKMVSTDKYGRRHFIRNTIIGIAVMLGVWWALFNVEVLYDAIGYRMEGMVAAFTGEGEVDASSRVRMNMIEIAIDLWKEEPLLGHGLDNYKHLNGLYVSAYAHNNYAELLATLGLLGLIAYYWYFVYLVIKLIKEKDMGMEKWFWSLAVICLAIFDYGMVSYDMYAMHLLLLQASIALRMNKGKLVLQDNRTDIENNAGEQL